MTLKDRARKAFEQSDPCTVLFLFDPEKDYLDEIDGWDVDDIRCVQVVGGTFGLKHTLETEWADARVLLYFTRPRPTGNELADFHLADVLLANKELYIDEQAEFLDAYGFERHQARLIAPYFASDLKYKNRQHFLASMLTPEAISEERLQRGLALFHLRMFTSAATSPRSNRLIAGVMETARNQEAFAKYRKACVERDLEETVCGAFQRVLEVPMPALELPHVRTAAQHAKYNFLIHRVDRLEPEDPYAKLRMSGPTSLSRLVAFINEWQQESALPAGPEETLSALAPEIDERQLIDVYGAEAPFGYKSPPIQQKRLERAVQLLEEQSPRVEALLDQLARDQQTDHPDTVAADMLRHMAHYYKLVADFAPFSFDSARDALEAYVSELHLADRHYRRAVEAYNTLGVRDTNHRSLVREVYRAFLRHYQDQFISPLNTSWQQRLEEQDGAFDTLNVGRQHAFYRDNIGADDRKIAVIISDAFRYEIGEELRSELLQDARKQVTLAPMIAGVPSTTALGMASLLPHKQLTIKDGSVLVDGDPASGTRGRENVLQQHRPGARAVSFEEIRDFSRDEGRALVTECSLLYIYHNQIDAIGDKRATEKRLVKAVRDTVEELNALVRTLNNWNARRVIITADHGFLYTEDEVTDDMQESFPEAKGIVERKPRYMVASSFPDGAAGYEFALAESANVASDLRVRVPRAVNRYQLQGSGKHFAHGGASLQELLVPVLAVYKAREEKSQKVTVQLVTDKRSIQGSVLKVVLLQAEAVSSTRKPMTVRVGLYNDRKELVSDEAELSLDATSSNPTQRQHKVMLTLHRKANDLTSCQLLVFDADDVNELNPVISQRFAIKRTITPDF